MHPAKSLRYGRSRRPRDSAGCREMHDPRAGQPAKIDTESRPPELSGTRPLVLNPAATGLTKRCPGRPKRSAIGGEFAAADG